LYLPVGGLILWFYLKRRRQESETVAPFEELKRRPAGESNRLRVEELNEKMDPWLMQILTVALAAIGLAHINKVELGRRNRLLPFLSRLVLRQLIASLLKGHYNSGLVHRTLRPVDYPRGEPERDSKFSYELIGTSLE